MSEVVRRLKTEIDQLSDAERGEIFEYLVGPEEYDPAFHAMLERHIEEMRSGKVVGRPVFEMLDELDRKFSHPS